MTAGVRCPTSAWVVLAFLATACGHASEDADSTPDAAATFACEICAYPGLGCFAPNIESVTLMIDEQTSTGCVGHLSTQPGSEWEIDCEGGQLCQNGKCQPATITDGSMTWSTATCHGSQ